VKMFVLDKGSDGKDQPPSTIATVHLKMTAGITGRMFIDDKDSMTVEDGQDVPISAGKHKIRIVGPVNACDTIVSLEGGKTTTLDCVLAPPSGSAAAQTGSAGSAAVAQVGSPEVKTPEVKAPEVKTPEVKTPEVKAPEVPQTKGSASVKTPEVKTETIKTRAPETKTTSHKTTETKTPEHTKTTESTKTETGAADPSKGYLQVFSKPVAKILVDGVDSGMKTPISGHTLALTPGKHKVTFVIGDDRFTYPVTIKQGSTETMSKDLQ